MLSYYIVMFRSGSSSVIHWRRQPHRSVGEQKQGNSAMIRNSFHPVWERSGAGREAVLFDEYQNPGALFRINPAIVTDETWKKGPGKRLTRTFCSGVAHANSQHRPTATTLRLRPLHVYIRRSLIRNCQLFR